MAVAEARPSLPRGAAQSMNISLLDGWLAPLLAALGSLALVAAVGWRTSSWRVTVIGLAAVTALIVVIVANVLPSVSLLNPLPPGSVEAWVGVAVFALLIAVAGWQSGSLRHRVLAPVAVVLTLLAAAGMVNDYYAYYPTLASVFDGGVHNRTSFAELRRRGLLTHLHAAAVPVGARTPVPEKGRIISVAIPPIASGFHARNALVYLPPAWFQRPRPRLPTIVLLAGSPGSPGDWFRAGFADITANRWAATHNGAAPVLVVPDENGSFVSDSECVDRPRARAETYVVADVRNFMIQTFDAPPEPGMWAIGGLSEGGTCALVLGLRHPDMFGAFADYSGDPAPTIGSPRTNLRLLFGGSVQEEQTYDPAALLTSHRYPLFGAWFELGSSDHSLMAPTMRLARLAAVAGADAHFVVRSGSHTFWVFHRSFADSLPWMWQRFELSGASAPAPARMLQPPTTARQAPMTRPLVPKASPAPARTARTTAKNAAVRPPSVPHRLR